jgi:hybrid cluster-associated redox disulfide protein
MTNPPITHEIIIGELIEAYPKAEAIIKKHFGNGCWTCPGMSIESLGFGAMMHGLDVEPIVQELRQVVGAETK